VRGAQNYMKLFVEQKMTRNNTLNKVHVAATELPQLLSQNTDMFREATAQSRRHTVQLNWKKINCWKSRGHVSQGPIVGDANEHSVLSVMREQDRQDSSSTYS